MAYDSGGSFDSFDAGGAAAPDAAASAAADAASAATAALAIEAAAAAAMSSSSTVAAPAASSGSDDWTIDTTPAPRAFAPTTPSIYEDDDWDGGSGRRAPARRGGVFGAIRRFFGMAGADEERVVELQAAVRRARQLHPEVGHQCTAEVAAQFGHPELDGLSANQQLATLRAHWRRVDASAAADLAGRGRLVVAGLENESGSGHTAVVVPGPGATHEGRFYPNVAGGGLPFRRSDGSRNAGEVWTPKERGRVAYFTPR